MKFHKMHGLGNDFVIFDARDQEINLNTKQITKICDRNLGVGCDQLIIIKNHPEANAEMIIFNADGSKAHACGNATRCVFQLLGGKQKKIFIFDKFIEARKAAKNLISIDMGAPKILKTEKKMHFLKKRDSRCLNVFDIMVGNHHLVVFEKLNSEERTTIGEALQTHEDYPGGINVNFADVQGQNLINLQTWERGTGFTHACGSGACATLVAANILGYTDASAVVSQMGGELNISYDGGHIFMEGPATYVFSAEIDLDRL